MRKTLYLGMLVVLVSIVLISTIGSSRYDEKGMEMAELQIVNSTQKYNISVIGSSDQRFDSESKEYVGNYERVIPLIQVAKPFALFIKNDSDHEIIGVSLRWKFLKSTGEVREVPQIEVNPGVLTGLKPLDPFMIGKTSIMNRGTGRFFSYFVMSIQQKIMLANMKSRNPNVSYPNKIDMTSQEINLISQQVTSQKEKLLESISSITVSVDGILFEDGTFVGEDKNFFFDLMLGRTQARKDLLTQIEDAKKADKSDKEILSVFLSDISPARRHDLTGNSGFENSEEAFQSGYKSSMKSLRREFARQRSNMPDSLVLGKFRSVKLGDFVTLRKVDD
jgi:hypothetical protein